MIKAISFDFYGVMYSNFDWNVINERIYSDESKLREFQHLIKAANNGEIGNDRFRIRTAELAEDQSHIDKPAVLIDPIVNSALMEFVRGLRTSHPQLKLAILSNGGSEHVGGVLKQQGYFDDFALIATSAELPCYKPEPQAFEYVANHLSVELEELLHIDDSPRHVSGARAAGVRSLQYVDLASFRQDLEKVINGEH